MLERIIQYSLHHKLIVLLFSFGIIGFGLFALSQIPIGAVPDVTNNQVQVITTSRNLATEDVEKFLTYPVELEMANLPGVKEIRSISKFGLSVVTVVFEDQFGTYLPRQLIAEKIKSAEEKIPAGFGKPFMGPISTGLGEIYQYVLEVDSAYHDQYSLTDLRTIQDWIVKRQLSGINGVVEVNTWGGYLKQYQVAIDPERLRSLNISVAQVFEALEKNNSIAGGGYIEKASQTYFIRGEGLIENLADIESISVENRAGQPILIRDLAKVGFGYATRFGAITGNGEGEKVLGQVMMLKGANSKAVIEAVKERVNEIGATLPPGVSINPFLERSELIGKTTTTIAENLILGCLIVIFVVVLLLGNLRSGLVVASVIPMCLLFALSLMYLFGVDANLMSLGAIDFGIIIDGAVIIVEYIAYRITSERQHFFALPVAKRQNFIDNVTFQGASKMMHSAVFGQLIIIIVFIPILSLVGVEGKMFRPMALVFCFALLGAMILCFTYVPVLAALFIRPGDPTRRTLSQRLIHTLEELYQPTIRWALRFKGLVLALAVVLLGAAIFLFGKMGGEFVPTLDEGDFVIQPVLKTGTSLNRTAEITTRIEQILGQFPEVQQVVSRIGAAEVPTDPMSMEESDVIIKLAPKDTWQTATTKDGLADAFKEALSILPGIEIEFTQPIEMRFNELITGVRADLAIKIFGEDLDLLYEKALEIEALIQPIEGAADITVEKVVGLPQISIEYDRQKIAKYGVSIEELNELISMAFAGKPAGTIFEGEKQFDLVVRFDTLHQRDMEDIQQASVQLPNGQPMPLSEFASITYTKGPAKISRDDTKRRIVVGVNVRNRDLESVVQDVQARVESAIQLPSGYSIQYGGQFENLRTARARLLVAVPIALALIFILLYFAFNSVKEALIIFSAIPLAAVGGVFSLYFRGMPFSISAGVGFIALFGIAVLNGIVLIEEFKELKAKGVLDINRRILVGTRKRLRPVLLTASAAALGFLPMALSTSAGAEVQRPLATVVVGGLITATALTLVVLPILYALFDRRGQKKLRGSAALFLLLGIPALVQGQGDTLSLEQVVQQALAEQPGLQASALRVQEQEQLLGTAIELGKTEFYFHFDQNNIALNNLPIGVVGINQAFPFPGISKVRRSVLSARKTLQQDAYALHRRAIEKEVVRAYYEVVYWQAQLQLYQGLDSLYQQLANATERRFEEGETDFLEKLTAQAKGERTALLLRQAEAQFQQAKIQLKKFIPTGGDFVVAPQLLPQLSPQLPDSLQHPGWQYWKDAVSLSSEEVRLERLQRRPDLNFSVFSGTNTGENAELYSGFQLGVAVPIWSKAYKARTAAAEVATLVLRAEQEQFQVHLQADQQALLAEIRQLEEALAYYQDTGKTLSERLRFHARRAYQSGEIDLLKYLQLLEQAQQIEVEHLETLYSYNQKVLDLNYR